MNERSFFGSRLREERERLGLSQQELADICAVTMRSQWNYEKGERLPDAAYLAVLPQTGIDTLYVLTGNRTVAPPPTDDSKERELLRYYKGVSREDQAAILRLAKTAARSGASAAGSGAGSTEAPAATPAVRRRAVGGK